MTELEKDGTIARLTEDNTRLYRENAELREVALRLQDECEELSRCIPSDPLKWF